MDYQVINHENKTGGATAETLKVIRIKHFSPWTFPQLITYIKTFFCKKKKKYMFIYENDACLGKMHKYALIFRTKIWTLDL